MVLGVGERTRTSTSLYETRPSTWRVYQFRHSDRSRASVQPASAQEEGQRERADAKQHPDEDGEAIEISLDDC